MLTLLARLGLRAGEVAGLGLDDIDWRRGELPSRERAAARDRLPLPVDVGEALAAYLRHGAPDRTRWIGGCSSASTPPTTGPAPA